MTGSVSKIKAIQVAKGDDAARAEVVRAIVRAKGVKRDAAELLGVSVPTLYRAIADLELWNAIDEACEKAGFTEHRGRDRGPLGGAA